MENTSDFLDALRVKLDLPSDGRLAVYLGMQRQYMSKYRTLGHTFDDAMSLRVADILEIDPAYVLACMHHQREKNEEVKKVWERLAKRLSAVAAVLAVLAVLPFGADIMSAPALLGDHGSLALLGFTLPSTSPTLYIMSNSLAGTGWFIPLTALLLAAFPRHAPQKITTDEFCDLVTGIAGFLS